jgi:predicted metallo-beta-lactamase superfamily hydrolase
LARLVKIKVLPVAFESFGVRSMCTYVETSDVKILLDAGVSLGPSRFRLAPHPNEYVALRERRSLMLEVAKEADVVTISHYHFDHHTPSYTDWASHWSSAETAKQIYEGKIVLVKSYRSRINPSQRRRGWMFARTGSTHARKLEFADGRSFQFGATTIRFPEPVYHGREHSELGWVLMAVIERGDEKVLFAPDVQGPLYEKSLKMILAEDPRLAIVGGPPVYLVDFRETRGRIDSAMRNLESIVERVPVTVLDHHVLRDEKWRETARLVFEKASSVGHELVTAAEYAGEENRLLESKRKQLYES